MLDIYLELTLGYDQKINRYYKMTVEHYDIIIYVACILFLKTFYWNIVDL